MKKFLAMAVAGCVLLHPVLAAAQAARAVPAPIGLSIQARASADAPLMAAVMREAGQLASRAGRLSPRLAAPQQAREGRSWIGRHPALFGAIAGAGAGLVAAGTMDNELFCSTGSDEDCLFYKSSRFAVGAGIGAGVGALVGWIVGRGRK